MLMLISILNISEPNRKKCIKNIEKHLRNYRCYKIAITNMEKQISFIDSCIDSIELNQDVYDNIELFNRKCINDKLTALKILKESIDRALSELTDLERKYIEYRYFNGWTVTKCSLKIGYSDKSLFNVRKQIMDKLLISLGGLPYIK